MIDARNLLLQYYRSLFTSALLNALSALNKQTALQLFFFSFFVLAHSLTRVIIMSASLHVVSVPWSVYQFEHR